MIIDLQEDGDPSESALVQSAGMKFARIPMNTRVPPTSEQVALFLQLTNDPVNQPVYVHCAGGRHRTGVMTAVYRMTQGGRDCRQGVQGNEAIPVRRGFPAPGVQAFVYAYYQELPAPVGPLAAMAGTK
jgi:protein-tyrosine phosphatase